MEDTELDPSELGTHNYWQQAYTKEISNFEDHGDPGDVWFGEDSADRVISWILCESGLDKDTAIIDLVLKEFGNKNWHDSKEISNFEDHGDPGDIWFGEDKVDRVISWILCESSVDKDTAIIDFGCGNGYTSIELAKGGFTNILGVDYCAEAITLAEKVAKSEFPSLKFQVFDITKDNVQSLGAKFGLAHDKGTYDAVSLNPDNAREHRRKYIQQVADMLTDSGIFVITSCNWTDDELLRQFSEKMKLKCVIPTPQFKFGGKVGSVVSSVVFEKISQSH